MPRLLVENGVDRGKSYIIQKDGSFFAGRDKAAQVQIHDEMASRRHFQIEHKGGQYFIRDLQSANGTFLNGSLVRKVEILAPNDRIQVGSTLISFQDDKPHPLIGREISGYRILDRIGRGGMGTVYRALQTSLDRVVALKVLAPHLVRNSNFVNLFIREARSAGSLSHPNIVQVYDVGVHEDIYFFSMEYIPEGSVEDLLNRGGPIPLARALRVIHDAARGLEYAERLGIVHRDIKPGNLMVGAGGVVKIGDLGISRSMDEAGQASQKDGVSGSPHYIAPEQARGDDIDTRADIYSLGVSLYQILSGRTPFRGATPREVILKHLKEDPPPLAELVENLPSDVVQLVEHMMAKSPANRVASAAKLLDELAPLLRRYSVDGVTSPTSSRRVRNLVVTLVGAALLVGVGFGAMAWWQDRQRQIAERTEELAGYDSELDRIRSAIEAGELEAARTALGALGAADLSDAQRIRLGSLETDSAALASRIEANRREAEAEAAFSQLAATIEAEAPPETANWENRVTALRTAATRWREFAAAHPDTSPAERARTRARELESRANTLQTREREAADELKTLFARYEDQVEKKHFRYALDILNEFRSERHQGTAAHQQWTEAKSTLQALEEAQFQNLSLVVQGLRDEGNARQAEVRLREFEDTIAFEKTRELWSNLFAEVKGDLNGGEQGLSDLERAQRRLASAYRDAWTAWAETMAGEKPANALADLDLRSELARAPELVDQLTDVRNWLRTWESTFTGILRRNPTLPSFPLYLKAEPDPRTAELVRLQRDRVVYRIGDQTYRPDWPDLSARGRAEVFLRIAESPQERVFVGLLAHLGGLPERGDAEWSAAAAADPAAAAIVERLRAGLELMR